MRIMYRLGALFLVIIPLIHGRGVLQPKDPKMLEGGTLHLNCSFSPGQEGDIKNLFFQTNATVKLENQRFGDRYLSNSSNITVRYFEHVAQLEWRNLTRDLHRGHIFCYNASSEHLLGHVALSVYRKPKKPRITNCTVDNWESMTCWYEPTAAEQTEWTGLTTNQTLYYTVFEDINMSQQCKMNGNRNQACYYFCHRAKDDSCEWRLPDHDYDVVLRLNDNYTIVILATHEVDTNGSVSNFFYVVPKTIVKPRQVEIVKHTTQKSKLFLQWKSPYERHDLLYRLRYKSQYDDEDDFQLWKEKNLTTLENTTLDTLIPYTTYTWRLDCIPLVDEKPKGFWSDVTTGEDMTKPDVPGALPGVTPGGYEIVDQNSIILRWQAIPREKQHGEIKAYRIHYAPITGTTLPRFNNTDCTNTNTCFAAKKSDGKLDTKYKLKLASTHDYVLYVDAITTEGVNTSLVPAPIVVSTSEGRSIKPDLVVLRNGSFYLFKWSKVEGATGYTIFWCKGLGACKKDTELEWHHIYSGNQTKYTMVLNKGLEDFAFALSVETASDRGVKSSGMHFSGSCIHDMTYEVKNPSKFEFEDDSEQQPEQLEVKWENLECHKTGFIEYYNLSYCKKSDCEQGKYQYEKVQRERESFTIKGLEGDVEYGVRLKAVSEFQTKSNYTPFIYHTVKRAGLRPGEWTLIAFAIVIALIIVLVGIYYNIRCCSKKAKDRLKGPKIVLPKKQEAVEAGIDSVDPTCRYQRQQSEGWTRIQGQNQENLRREGGNHIPNGTHSEDNLLAEQFSPNSPLLVDETSDNNQQIPEDTQGLDINSASDDIESKPLVQNSPPSNRQNPPNETGVDKNTDNVINSVPGDSVTSSAYHSITPYSKLADACDSCTSQSDLQVDFVNSNSVSYKPDSEVNGQSPLQHQVSANSSGYGSVMPNDSNYNSIPPPISGAQAQSPFTTEGLEQDQLSECVAAPPPPKPSLVMNSGGYVVQGHLNNPQVNGTTMGTTVAPTPSTDTPKSTTTNTQRNGHITQCNRNVSCPKNTLPESIGSTPDSTGLDSNNSSGSQRQNGGIVEIYPSGDFNEFDSVGSQSDNSGCNWGANKVLNGGVMV